MTDDPNATMDDNGAPPRTDKEVTPVRPEDVTDVAPGLEPPIAFEAAPAAEEGRATGADAAPAPAEQRRDAVVGVLIVLTLVLLAATVLFGLMAFAPRIAPIKSESTRLAIEALEEKDITDVAERFAENFWTIDYRTIDADISRLNADATGRFKTQIGEVLEASRPQFEKRETTSTGVVRQAVLLFHEEESARVQVLGERTMRSKGTDEDDERLERKVLDITLVKTSAGWKVDEVREVEVQDEA